MKLPLAFFALVSFGVFVPGMYADDLSLNLTALGGTTVNVPGVATATGDVFTYDRLAVPVFQNSVIVGLYNLNFTAAYVDVGTFPTGVTSELLVTESCVDVTVSLSPVSNPCTGISFAYTNTNVAGIVDVLGGVNIGADVNANLIAADAGLGIGAGSETIEFGNPPAATPEPGSMSLLGTGLLGVAGVLRRRFRA